MGLPQKIGSLIAQGFRLGTLQNPEEEVHLTINGWEHVVNYALPWFGFEGSIPNRFSADPRYPGLNLMEGTAKKFMGNIALIQLVYRTPDYPITTTDGVPPDEFHESPSTQQASIVLNARFANATYYPVAQQVWRQPDGTLVTGDTLSPYPPTDGTTFDHFTANSPDAGQETYYQGGKTVTWLTYSARLSANLFDTSINDPPDADAYPVISDPPDRSSSGNYLLLVSEVNPAGLWWIKKNTYLFNDNAWSTNAYATG